MAKEEELRIRGKELKRVHILRQVQEGRLSQKEGGEHLGLTDRQIRRLLRRLGKEGEKGLCHRGRGKPSNRRKGQQFKQEVLLLCRKKYEGFGPQLAAEKLLQRDGMRLSDETLRLWFKEAGIEYESRRKKPHRRWRERRGRRGEMLQMDGSDHDWLEGRGPRCVLMAYIDDATNEVYARFYEYEGTYPAMDGFMRYLQAYGVPLAVYVDKHSTYRSQAAPRVEDQLLDQRPMSQFERALGELGVELIHAHSPQAKGRIERLFRTFQDRLIKEMRLEGIKSLQEANRFLEGYLPGYNKRFSLPPAQQGDQHRPRPSRQDLERILCVRTERALRNDFTVSHEGKLYQVEENVRATKIVVEERLNGSVYLTYKGRALRYQPILSRPTRPETPPEKHGKRRRTKPSKDHPWKKFDIKGRRNEELSLTA